MSAEASTLHGTTSPRFTSEDVAGVDNSWLGRLAAAYLAKRLARAHVTHSKDAATESERARAAIRAACVKCALTGAASGTLTTIAELVTAETGGLAAVATIPVAGVTVGGEMVFRAIVHLGLTCDLAEIYGVPFDAKDRTGFWRLCALAFGVRADDGRSGDLGQQLVKSMLQPDEDVGSSIGSKLLAEGLWFLFGADGRLSAEETGVLAYLVRLLPPGERAAVMARFVEDEHDWLERLAELPESERDDFFRALEVAATVDEVVSQPERRILRGAARALGRTFDDTRIERMVKDFGDAGVLRDGRPSRTST